jgi:MFS family permease
MAQIETQPFKVSSPARRSGLGSAGILLVACVCGWAVMELEILGVVTGSVIGVFLLSLAVGYMVGGWLSGLGRPRRTLGAVILAAGACLCAMPFAIVPICDAVFNLELDVKWGSLLASLALFGIPTALLGTVSPMVVHWLTADTGRSGFHAGIAMAISTVASFIGCIVTAFYLVLYSLRTTLVATGIALAVLGLLMLLMGPALRQENATKGSADA